MKYIFTIVLVSLSVVSFSQMFPQMTQYFLDPVIYNPSYAGHEIQTTTSLLYRNQWVGIEGAPKTVYLNIHKSTAKQNVGIGASVINDRIGPVQVTSIRPQYVYKIRQGINSLRFGLGLELLNLSVQNKWKTKNSPGLDPTIASATSSKWLFDAAFGVSWAASDYDIGLAFDHLLGARSSDHSFQFQRSVTLLANYTKSIYFLGRNMTVESSFIANAELNNIAGLQLSFNAITPVFQDVLLGGGYRMSKAVMAIVGYQFYTPNGKFRIIYSYDYEVNSLNRINFGTHEFGVKYFHSVGRYKSKNENGDSGKHKNVRFL